MSRVPVILFSGWAIPSEFLNDFAEALDHPVAYFDLCNRKVAGHRRTISVAAQKIIAAQPAPPLLIGWSTGALVALEAATRSKASIAGIVALSGTACFCRRTAYAFGQATQTLQALQEGVRSEENKVRTLTRFFCESAYPDRLSRAWRDQLTRAASMLDGDILAAGLDYLLETDIRHQLQAITTPALFIHGEGDAIIPAQAAQWAADRVPAATLHTLPGAGHLLPLLQPEKSIERIQAFIQEVLL